MSRETVTFIRFEATDGTVREISQIEPARRADILTANLAARFLAKTLRVTTHG